MTLFSFLFFIDSKWSWSILDIKYYACFCLNICMLSHLAVSAFFFSLNENFANFAFRLKAPVSASSFSYYKFSHKSLNLTSSYFKAIVVNISCIILNLFVAVLYFNLASEARRLDMGLNSSAITSAGVCLKEKGLN